MGKYGQKALHVHADDSSNCHFNCLHMSEARAARVQAEVKRRHKGHLICQLGHEASPQPELTLTAAPRQCGRRIQRWMMLAASLQKSTRRA